jgi:hypothetical protein
MAPMAANVQRRVPSAFSGREMWTIRHTLMMRRM